MAPRQQQSEEVRAERQRQILAAAIPLFARQGFDATSVSQAGEQLRFFAARTALCG